MFVGQVAGEITSTINHPDYDNRRLLVVDRLARQYSWVSVVIASCFFQYQYRFGWGEEQTVSISAGQKFHVRIGLTLVSLKAQRQFAVRLIQLNSLGVIRLDLLSERLRSKTGVGRGSCLHHWR